MGGWDVPEVRHEHVLHVAVGVEPMGDAIAGVGALPVYVEEGEAVGGVPQAFHGSQGNELLGRWVGGNELLGRWVGGWVEG